MRIILSVIPDQIGDPVKKWIIRNNWIPIFMGMTKSKGLEWQ